MQYTKMWIVRVFAMILFSLALGAQTADAQESANSPALIPPDAEVVLYIPDIHRLAGEIATSPLSAVIEEPSLAEVRSLWGQFAEKWNTYLARSGKLTGADMWNALGSVTVVAADVSYAASGATYACAYIVTFSANGQKIASFLTEYTRAAGWTQKAIAGADAVVLPDGQALYCDSTLAVLASNEEMLTKILTQRTGAGDAQQPPANPYIERFRDVARNEELDYALFCDPSALVPAYFASGLAEPDDPTRDVVDLLGIPSVKGLAITSDVGAAGITDSIYFWVDPSADSILNHIYTAPVDMKTLSAISQDVREFNLISADIPKMYEYVFTYLAGKDAAAYGDLKTRFEAAAQAAGVDVQTGIIGNLASDVLLVKVFDVSERFLPPYLTYPNVGMFIRMKNPDAFKTALDNVVTTAAAESSAALAPSEAADMRVFAPGGFFAFPVKWGAAYIYADDMLIASFSAHNLQDAVALAAGDASSSMMTASVFTNAFSELGGISYGIFYTDLAETFAGYFQKLRKYQDLLVIPFADSSALGDYAGAIDSAARAHLAPLVASAVRRGEDTVIKARSPVGAFTGLYLIAGTGKAYDVLSTFDTVKLGPTAEEIALKDACRENLYQIAAALELYAVEHNGFFPETLDEAALNLPSAELVTCPAAAAAGAEGRYVYVAGLVWEDDPSAVLLYDASAYHYGNRAVLFVDGHVEMLDESAFQAKLKGQ